MMFVSIAIVLAILISLIKNGRARSSLYPSPLPYRPLRKPGPLQAVQMIEVSESGGGKRIPRKKYSACNHQYTKTPSAFMNVRFFGDILIALGERHGVLTGNSC